MPSVDYLCGVHCPSPPPPAIQWSDLLGCLCAESAWGTVPAIKILRKQVLIKYLHICIVQDKRLLAQNFPFVSIVNHSSHCEGSCVSALRLQSYPCLPIAEYNTEITLTV